jgi:hypothetical protein
MADEPSATSHPSSVPAQVVGVPIVCGRCSGEGLAVAGALVPVEHAPDRTGFVALPELHEVLLPLLDPQALLAAGAAPLRRHHDPALGDGVVNTCRHCRAPQSGLALLLALEPYEGDERIRDLAVLASVEVPLAALEGPGGGTGLSALLEKRDREVTFVEEEADDDLDVGEAGADAEEEDELEPPPPPTRRDLFGRGLGRFRPRG